MTSLCGPETKRPKLISRHGWEPVGKYLPSNFHKFWVSNCCVQTKVNERLYCLGGSIQTQGHTGSDRWAAFWET